jgi:hypothetical protein
MIIDAPGRVAPPDAQFPYGKILNVKEHVSSASRAYAHAFPLFSRPPLKSRKRALPILKFALICQYSGHALNGTSRRRITGVLISSEILHLRICTVLKA